MNIVSGMKELAYTIIAAIFAFFATIGLVVLGE